MKKPIRLILFLVLVVIFSGSFVFSKVIAVFPEVQKPGFISIDGEQVYLIDGDTVHIYSFGEFQFKKKFGKRGEGPKEFKFEIGFLINTRTDYILVESIGKVSYFSKGGEFIKEQKFQSNHSRFLPLDRKGHKFVGTARTFGGKSRYLALHVFGSRLEKGKEICRSNVRPGKGKIKFLSYTWNYDTYGGKVYIAGKNDFTVEVYDINGKKSGVIKRDYERIKVDKNYVDHFFKWVKKNRSPDRYQRMKRLFEFPDKIPAIQRIIVENDRLYVQTYKQKEGKNEFFIFRLDGKLTKRVFLPLSREHPIDPLPYTIYNGKLYQLVENEDSEEWELIETAVF